MPLEGPPKKQEKKHSSLLEVGALATALLLQSHPQAKALEIPTDTPWATAIQESIKQSAKKETNEYLFTYLKYKDGSGKWMPTIEGTHGRVSPNFEEGSKQIKQNTLNEYSRITKPVEAICIGHTHPWQPHLGFKTSQPLTKDMLERRSQPPSEGDIKMVQKTERGYARQGIHSNIYGQLKYLAADRRGIWYFEKVADTDNRTEALSKEALKQFEQDYGALVIKSIDTESTDLVTTIEYKKLLESYQTNLGGKVRFVPYEKVKDEPPCAGVDFDATKKIEQHQEVYTPKHTN